MNIGAIIKDIVTKMEALEEEYRILSEENADLRRQIASYQAQGEGGALVENVQQNSDALEKLLKIDMRFHNLVDRQRDEAVKNAIRNQRSFIIQRMIEDDADFESARYTITVKRRSVQFKIQLTIEPDYGLCIQRLFIGDKWSWCPPNGVYNEGIIRWEEFTEACTYWVEHLQEFPSTAERFGDELIKRNLL